MKEYERDIVKAVVDYLSLKGYLFVRNNTGSFKTAHGSFVKTGSPGSPDIILFLEGGIAYALECKIAKGKLNDNQVEWKRRADEIGLTYLIIRSLDDLVSEGI